MTGVYYSNKDTTEILVDKKWKILPGIATLRGLKLATVNNQVFAFGMFQNLFYVFYFLLYSIKLFL